jgi:hypothetical protein
MSMVRSSFARTVLRLVLGWLLFVAAPAVPNEFDVDKNLFFNQTSGSQPTAAASWQFGAQIIENNISAATLTPPGGTPISMGGAVEILHANAFFTNQSQLDTAFPDGNYTFGVTINSSHGTASLTMPDSSFYPATVPFVTSSSFSAIQHYNPAQSLQLTWNSFGRRFPTLTFSSTTTVISQPYSSRPQSPMSPALLRSPFPPERCCPIMPTRRFLYSATTS